MRYRTLVICACLAALGVMAKRPSSPYVPPGPDLASLLPFTPAESRAFKEAKVYRIECSWDKTYNTTYRLDQDGRVITSEATVKGKGKGNPKVEATCDYQYDAAGRLVLRTQRDPHNVFIDTIAYDADGRITFYRSTMLEVRGSRPPRLMQTFWDLRRSDPHPRGHVLTGGSMEDTTLYQLNGLNEVIWASGYGRTDSLVMEKDTAGNTLRSYWYRQDSTGYQLGRQDVLRDGRLLSATRSYDMAWSGSTMIDNVSYHYDDTGKLLRVERENPYQPREFFTYYANGLVMAHMILSQQDVRVERFTYWH